MKTLRNTILFILFWAVAGTLVGHGLQSATPVIDGWLELLVYGRVTEFFGAIRIFLWTILYMGTRLAPWAAALFIGAPIASWMDRHPSLALSHQKRKTHD